MDGNTMGMAAVRHRTEADTADVGKQIVPVDPRCPAVYSPPSIDADLDPSQMIHEVRMRLVRRLIHVAFLGSSFLLLGHAQISRLAPGDQPDFDIQYVGGDKPLPRWENGYVLTFEHEPENAPLVSVFSSQGSKVFSTSLALDGVVKFQIRSIAASLKGVFAVSGGALDSSGSGANVIVYLDSTGAVTQVVRLKDFAGTQLCFAEDNRLWVAGRDRSKPGPPADHDIIRVYDDKGIFQKSFLRRSLFSTDRHPAVGLSHIAANRQNVALFSSETGYLIVMSKGGDVLSIRHVPLAPERWVTGLALSGASEAVISSFAHYGMTEQITFHILAADASRWTEIYSQGSPNNRYSKLYGFSGENLLVGSYHPFKFSWVRIQR